MKATPSEPRQWPQVLSESLDLQRCPSCPQPAFLECSRPWPHHSFPYLPPPGSIRDSLSHPSLHRISRQMQAGMLRLEGPLVVQLPFPMVLVVTASTMAPAHLKVPVKQAFEGQKLESASTAQSTWLAARETTAFLFSEWSQNPCQQPFSFLETETPGSNKKETSGRRPCSPEPSTGRPARKGSRSWRPGA